MMYLKKLEGPRIITMPDGSTLTRADLPPKGTVRWVKSRKAIVVKAVKYGLISQDEALDRYSLTLDELESWRGAVDRHGEDALKATSIQKYRQL